VYAHERARGGTHYYATRCLSCFHAPRRHAVPTPVARGPWPDPPAADVVTQEKHPSALGAFESVLAAAKGKQVVMFLDYDGTLSPIVKDPDSAVMTDEVSSSTSKQFPVPLGPSRVEAEQSIASFMLCSPRARARPPSVPDCVLSPQMRDAVRGVAELFPTAIVSGRCRDKVHSEPQPSRSCLVAPPRAVCESWPSFSAASCKLAILRCTCYGEPGRKCAQNRSHSWC
jgi:trehalose 6-phosphate phosphatase